MRIRDAFLSLALCSYAVATGTGSKYGEMRVVQRQVDPTLESNEPFVPTTARCGNGVVDEGEECDCGDSWTCEFGSDSCCDAETCKFKPGAVCNHHDEHEKCCESCQFKPKNTLCRPSKSYFCDPVEEMCTGKSATCPPDVTEPNGKECGVGLSCASGLCTSLQNFCAVWVDSDDSELTTLFDKSEPYQVLGSCYEELKGSTKHPNVRECDHTCNVIGKTHRMSGGRLTNFCFSPGMEARGYRVKDSEYAVFPDGMNCTNPETPWKVSMCLKGKCVNTHNTTDEPVDRTSQNELDREAANRKAQNDAYNDWVWRDETVSKGAIAGYAVGGSFALALIVGVVWFIVRRHRKEDEETALAEKNVFSGGAAPGVINEKAAMPIITEEEEPPRTPSQAALAAEIPRAPDAPGATTAANVQNPDEITVAKPEDTARRS